MNDLKDWLKQFPRAEAEGKIRQLESELASWRQALEMYDSLTGEGGRSSGSAPASQQEPNKPQAILLILRDAGKALSPGEILVEMVERGWLPGDAKYKKRFYATLSRMNSEERVSRLANGRYVLPPNSQEALAKAF